MRILLALILLGHGIAHLPGFLVPWKLVSLEDMPYQTTILAGKVDIDNVGIRVVGILWLVSALAFAAASVGAGLRFPWWQSLTLVAATFSLLLCIIGWPEARFGLFINLALIAFLLVNRQLGWMP